MIIKNGVQVLESFDEVAQVDRLKLMKESRKIYFKNMYYISGADLPEEMRIPYEEFMRNVAKVFLGFWSMV